MSLAEARSLHILTNLQHRSGADRDLTLSQQLLEGNTVIVPNFGVTTKKVWRTPPAQWVAELWAAAGNLNRARRLLSFSLGASWSLRLLPLAPNEIDAAVFVAGYPTPGARALEQEVEGRRLSECRAKQLWLHSTSDALCPWQSGS